MFATSLASAELHYCHLVCLFPTGVYLNPIISKNEIQKVAPPLLKVPWCTSEELLKIAPGNYLKCTFFKSCSLLFIWLVCVVSCYVMLKNVNGKLLFVMAGWFIEQYCVDVCSDLCNCNSRIIAITWPGVQGSWPTCGVRAVCFCCGRNKEGKGGGW